MEPATTPTAVVAMVPSIPDPHALGCAAGAPLGLAGEIALLLVAGLAALPQELLSPRKLALDLPVTWA